MRGNINYKFIMNSICKFKYMLQNTTFYTIKKCLSFKLHIKYIFEEIFQRIYLYAKSTKYICLKKTNF